MTFSTWLRTQTKRDDAIGDFARDWVLDRSSKKPRGHTALQRCGITWRSEKHVEVL